MDNATLTGVETGLALASIKMAASLLLVLAAIFLVFALLKRYGFAARLQGRGVGRLRIEERLPLGPRKQLVLVRFLNKLLVLSVTETQVNLITQHQADHEPLSDFQSTLDQESRENSSS